MAYNGIDKVNSHLYVGGDPMYSRNLAADIDLLNEHVDVIIDCRSVDERHNGWDVEPGVEPVVIYAPMHDDGQNTNSTDDFHAAYEQLQELIGNGIIPNNPVMFVHCHMGVNRGPSMALFMLMIEHNMPIRAAWELMHSSREGMGIAYARTALAALLERQDHSPTVILDGLDMWDQFDQDYWTPEREHAVIQRVRTNRTGRIVYTEDGRAHGLNSQEG